MIKQLKTGNTGYTQQTRRDKLKASVLLAPCAGGNNIMYTHITPLRNICSFANEAADLYRNKVNNKCAIYLALIRYMTENDINTLKL